MVLVVHSLLMMALNPAVAYSVAWNDRQGAGFVTVTSGAQLTGQAGADPTSASCGTTGGSTADVQVTILAADLLAAPAGTLTGTLFLEVAPE